MSDEKVALIVRESVFYVISARQVAGITKAPIQ